MYLFYKAKPEDFPESLSGMISYSNTNEGENWVQIQTGDDGKIAVSVGDKWGNSWYRKGAWSPQEIINLIINLRHHMEVHYPDFNFESM